ncbi:MAG: hypothetical protein RMJ98_22925, partial [Myxococcales bacterium]|nr:hypothetical protein [Myxococcales bacterium]
QPPRPVHPYRETICTVTLQAVRPPFLGPGVSNALKERSRLSICRVSGAMERSSLFFPWQERSG